MKHFYFVCMFMSDIILSGSSSDIWREKKRNILGYWQEGSTTAAIQWASTFDVISQHNKIKGIAFKVALVYYMKNNFSFVGLASWLQQLSDLELSHQQKSLQWLNLIQIVVNNYYMKNLSSLGTRKV